MKEKVVTMNLEDKKAYAEVDEILSKMENKYVEKIPKRLRQLIKDKRLQDYKPQISTEIPLDNQNLQKKTYYILAMLNLNYWCDNEEEKKKLIATYTENDKRKEQELREKYNPDNLFKKEEIKTKKEQEENNIALVEYKKSSFIKKVINKIISLFRK